MIDPGFPGFSGIHDTQSAAITAAVENKTMRGCASSVYIVDESAFLPQPSAQVVEVEPVPDSWYEEQAKIEQEIRAQKEATINTLIEQVKEMLPAGIGHIQVAMAILSKAMKEDPSYAWSWHCNLAMPIYDQGVSHSTANLAAARLMEHIFNADTMTQVQSDQDAARRAEG